MYLVEGLVLNNGAIRDLNLRPSFRADGAPKPLLIVGPNGSGKSNLLSILADGLVEQAAKCFTDVAPPVPPMGHSFFRLLGPGMVSVGASYSAAFLRFEYKSVPLCYRETQGETPDLSERLADRYPGVDDWRSDAPSKGVAGPKEAVKEAFEKGICCFFPSSRSETPYWLNVEGFSRDLSFVSTERIRGKLYKPIFVEQSFSDLIAWILDVILDGRVDAQTALRIVNNQARGPELSYLTTALQRSSSLTNIVRILRIIMMNDQARLACGGRQDGSFRLRIADQTNPMVPSIANISTGQSTLFSIFCTILRSADMGDPTQSQNPGTIEGVVLIDEADAHLHADLQYNVFPLLIQLFPRVQFVMTTHSPLLLLGMERVFGSNNMEIIELPDGHAITTERFAEFEHSFNYYKQTVAFDEAIKSFVAATSVPLILTEGETDPKYLRTPAELLGFEQILEDCKIEWVGAKRESAPQGFNTGAPGLNHTLQRTFSQSAAA